ncbi:L-gulonolactone oxidase [Microtus ochrogaster]|uniref:L-gulonolactone oxidase n=1 Tax=Microtus ochrogaster TaxID=79684 RepID=A0A8J6GUW3_MICOH|nr:L-gulonolactone oxidase [Microtus ochrogaster]
MGNPMNQIIIIMCDSKSSPDENAAYNTKNNGQPATASVTASYTVSHLRIQMCVCFREACTMLPVLPLLPVLPELPMLPVLPVLSEHLYTGLARDLSDLVHGCKGFQFQNWAKTYGCCPEMYYQPTSVEEVREVLALARQQNKRVKVVGGGHSPSDIACTDGFMIHMGKMNRVLQVDTKKKQVKVEAGILLADLHLQLDKHGLAMSNLGAVSDVTIAGVIGSGTHNTGIKHGILATQVVALTLMTADGTVLECSESSNVDVFQAARVHLGCLGIILTVTLQCVPQFHLQETSFPSTLKERTLDVNPAIPSFRKEETWEVWPVECEEDPRGRV